MLVVKRSEAHSRLIKIDISTGEGEHIMQVRNRRSIRKPVYGVGVNDVDYNICNKLEGWVCPYYKVWVGVLARCYGERTKTLQPTYRDCTMCDEWKYLSKFKEWMQTQDWQGKQLDKDILVEGNKVYSPDTCVFVYGVVNNFVTDSAKSRGDYMIGVHRELRYKKKQYKARISNPFTKKEEFLGIYATELEAHLAWKRRKYELACMLADSEYVTDDRVGDALKRRYENF